MLRVRHPSTEDVDPDRRLAAGYLAIILVFAGSCGMPERFAPGSLSGASTASIGDWCRVFSRPSPGDYTGSTPVIGAARMLVGLGLVLSVEVAFVVFAAVMSSNEPRLNGIGGGGGSLGRE